MRSRLDEKTTGEVKQLLDTFLQTWNDKDLDGYTSLFVSDAEFTEVVGQTAMGREAIRKQHEFAFNVVMKHASLEINNLLIREVHPKVIMVTANWLNQNSQTPQGQPLPERNGVLQFVIVKDSNGKRKFRLVHNADFSLPYQRQEKFFD